MKRTPAIDKYVVRRWAELRAEGRPDYRAALALEVENNFEVKLSGETLRQIVNACGHAANPETSGPGGVVPPAPMATVPADLVSEECICYENLETTSTDLVPESLETSPQDTFEVIPVSAGTPEASKCFPPNWQSDPGEAMLCDHVGMLMFATALSTIPHATTPSEPLLAQWLGSILLGALNIEQTKYLNWGDLGNLLGNTVRFPTPQREQSPA